MSIDWFGEGIDPTSLPKSLQAAHAYWVSLAGDGGLPTRDHFNPLALSDDIQSHVAIFEVASPSGEARGNVRLAGAAVIAFYGAGLGSQSLRELVHEPRRDLVDDLSEIFADGGGHLPILARIDRPRLKPDSTLHVLILPLREEPGRSRLVAAVYHFDKAGTV